MINFLTTSNQISKANVEQTFLEHEILFNKLIITYIKEIPPDFLSFYNTRDKRTKVEQHLKKIYDSEKVDSYLIERVLKRVLNLARVVNSKHRTDYEDKLKQTEFKKNNWNKIKRCQICGENFKDWRICSLEHVLPLSLGGDDSDLNWQLLCKRCNHDKSSFFGSSSINRSLLLSEYKIFKYLSQEDKIKNLPKNYRYLIMERDKRKCSLCSNDSKNKQLYVTIKNYYEIVSYDNLYTICEVCLRSNRINKNNTL